MAGYGCYQFASGAIYTGQWFEGKMHGQGTYTYADGECAPEGTCPSSAPLLALDPV